MPGWIKPFILLGMLLLINLSSCTGPTAQPVNTSTIPFEPTISSPSALATPYAQEPAAGICAYFPGNVVTVTINTDIPDPRCTKVHPDQTLAVVNNTLNSLVVTIGRFTANVEPGDKTIINTPFGEYLEPGVHQLQVSPCCGAELWLEATK